MIWRLLTGGLLVGMAMAGSADAHVISFSSTVPLFEITPAAGTAVTSNFLINNGLPPGIVFDEQQDVTLGQDLSTDTGAVIAAGTVVSSHYLAFNANNGADQTTTVTFDAPILGIEFADGGFLGASDILGLATLSYNSGCGLCGYEPGETATFVGNIATFNSGFSTPGDFARIITAAGAVPEPGAASLMILGLGLAGFLARRRLACAGLGPVG